MTAAGSGFAKRSFEFLRGLSDHNEAPWFHAHRDEYRETLEEPFADLLEHVSRRLADTPTPLRGGRETMFRINRDVRFSADKSPYRCEVSGLLTPSGTKTESTGLVYVQIHADGGAFAGGLYQPSATRLQPLRRRMLEHPRQFATVMSSLAESGRELDRSDAVKTMPRGFAQHADHRWADIVRLKQLVVQEDLPMSTWVDDTVADRVVAFVADLSALFDFVSEKA